MRFWESTSSMSLILTVNIPYLGRAIERLGLHIVHIIPRSRCRNDTPSACRNRAIIGVIEGFSIKLSLCNALLFNSDMLGKSQLIKKTSE